MVGAFDFKVALVDDNLLFRQLTRNLLEQNTSIQVCIDAHNGLDFLTQLQLSEKLPDVVLLDIHMPLMNGPQTARELTAHYPTIKIITFSTFDHPDVLNEMYAAGAKAYISKTTDRVVLYETIAKVATSIDLVTRNSSKNTVLLTPKQKQFLILCASELAYKEIAIKMKISPNTVNRYREDLFFRLNIKSRVGLVLYAMQVGLIGMV
jgi:two-component system invasion response regulator UvrY